MTTVKVYLEGPDPEIRRFVADINPYNAFKGLKERIKQAFPSLSDTDFTLSWKDADGDNIIMSSDPELSEALANAQNNILKVYIKKQEQQRSTSSNATHIHAGVTCDMCNTEVRGVRYKCLQCEDYDLCEACHAKKTHEQHDMLKLVNPGNRPIWSFPGWRRLWKHCARTQMGSRSHHHGWGHRRGAARGAEASDAEPSGAEASPPPCEGAPPQGAAGDAFTAARAQYHELLNGIGDTIANLLDPLGINVAYHVDTGARTQTGTEASTQPETTGAPSTEKKDSATEPMDTASSAASVPDASGADTKTTETAPAARTSAVGIMTPLYPAVQEPDVSYGWTVVNPADSSPRPNDASAPVENVADPRIESALSQMVSMGFNNEGGWLRQLLEVKQGDIGAVLESLHPTRH